MNKLSDSLKIVDFGSLFLLIEDGSLKTLSGAKTLRRNDRMRLYYSIVNRREGSILNGVTRYSANFSCFVNIFCVFNGVNGK